MLGHCYLEFIGCFEARYRRNTQMAMKLTQADLFACVFYQHACGSKRAVENKLHISNTDQDIWP